LSPPGYTVGVYDSGVGGLSVLRALLVAIPEAHFVYVADQAYAPYGERGAAAVTERAHRITAGLRRDYPLDALVVACNTATAQAIDHLRQTHHDLPIVGVEPALKPAAALTATGHIGVLATRGTVESARFHQLQQRLQKGDGSGPHFHSQACDGLAQAIERDDTALIQTLCERYVHAVQATVPSPQQIDTWVLGCTHYLFAADILRPLCGGQAHLIETGTPVARRTREVLLALRPSPAHAHASLTLLSTADPTMLARLAHRWLGVPEQAQLWQA